MAKVILICGKICSGKSFYARKLQEQENAVILSTDEATFDLIDNVQGEFYDRFARRVNGYLMKKAAQIARAGANVILDWGFWTAREREEVSRFFREQEIEIQWHFMDIDPERWMENIRERNERIRAGRGGSDFYVDEGLLRKVVSGFEVPQRDQIHIWCSCDREEISPDR